jgi:hypothetical protein
MVIARSRDDEDRETPNVLMTFNAVQPTPNHQCILLMPWIRAHYLRLWKLLILFKRKRCRRMRRFLGTMFFSSCRCLLPATLLSLYRCFHGLGKTTAARSTNIAIVVRRTIGWLYTKTACRIRCRYMLLDTRKKNLGPLLVSLKLTVSSQRISCKM